MIQPDLECFLSCDSEISFLVTKRLLLRAGKVFLGLDTTVSSQMFTVLKHKDLQSTEVILRTSHRERNSLEFFLYPQCSFLDWVGEASSSSNRPLVTADLFANLFFKRTWPHPSCEQAPNHGHQQPRAGNTLGNKTQVGGQIRLSTVNLQSALVTVAAGRGGTK